MGKRGFGTGLMGDGRPVPPRIWPVWARSLGAMIEAGAIVRFACPSCRKLYDVDMEALVMLRGRSWSLIDRTARCKASKCRTRGLFVIAAGPSEPFVLLHGREPMPSWLVGARPKEHEPTEPPPPPPPAPPGVDPVRWGYARDDRERKRLIREARG